MGEPANLEKNLLSLFYDMAFIHSGDRPRHPPKPHEMFCNMNEKRPGFIIKSVANITALITLCVDMWMQGFANIFGNISQELGYSSVTDTGDLRKIWEIVVE